MSSKVLQPHEIEALIKLSEECGEVVQAISKILLHGLHGQKHGEGLSNLQRLESELGDVVAASGLCASYGILDLDSVGFSAAIKALGLHKHLPHYSVIEPNRVVTINTTLSFHIPTGYTTCL